MNQLRIKIYKLKDEMEGYAETDDQYLKKILDSKEMHLDKFMDLDHKVQLL